MLDRATIVGLLALGALLVWVIAVGAGATAEAFWQWPALVLVIGGSMLATAIASPNAGFGSMVAVLRNVFCVRTPRPEASIITLVALAEVARRDGLLALDKPVGGLKDDFLKRAMHMAIDGLDPRTIELVLQAEMESIDLRHTAGKGVLDSMAGFAPAFGMIGTLIGLVVMLGQLNDPSKIGPGMAVALLTTLYGLIVANVFCLPLARRLAHRSSEELLAKTIVLKGVLAIQAGDHPRVVAQKLRVYLPGAGREHEFASPALRRQVLAEETARPDAAHQGQATIAPADSGPRIDEAQAKVLAKQLEKALKGRRPVVDAA